MVLLLRAAVTAYWVQDLRDKKESKEVSEFNAHLTNIMVLLKKEAGFDSLMCDLHAVLFEHIVGTYRDFAYEAYLDIFLCWSDT